MDRIWIFFILFCLIPAVAGGQTFNPNYSGNLVPNHSFEDTVDCPFTYSLINYTQSWFSPTPASPDYFNSCSNPGTADVPNNYFAHQYPRTGEAYTGIFSFYNDNRNYQEYIETRLKEPLTAGKEYCVFFYISLADNALFAADGIGALFTTDSVFGNSDSVLANYTPQVMTNAIITDEAGWVYIGGSFIASGGEQFITIGNFNYNIDIQSTSVPGIQNIDYNAAYYLIDDVYVGTCDTLDTIPPAPIPPLITAPNVFTPNGDGVNDIFTLETAAIKTMNCEIFNRWGIKVATLSQLNEGWDGRTTSGEGATEGVYYYAVTARDKDGKEYRKRGFIQLLR